VLALGLSTAFVTPLKQLTQVQCPWSLTSSAARNLQQAAGATPGYRQAGLCWPGGHAATGFCLFALFFVLRDRKPRLAKAALGWRRGRSVLSVGRMMQGAHFSRTTSGRRCSAGCRGWGLITWSAPVAEEPVVERSVARQRSSLSLMPVRKPSAARAALDLAGATLTHQAKSPGSREPGLFLHGARLAYIMPPMPPMPPMSGMPAPAGFAPEVGNHGFGGDHQTADRSCSLQGRTGDLGWVQDAHLDHVAVFAGSSVVSCPNLA
jgi:hypothetical protein